MDKKASPGISFKKIELLECSVGRINMDAELKFSVGIDTLNRVVTDSGGSLVVVVGFNLMQDVQTPACCFTCTFSATYSRPLDANMTWDEFKDHIAVAHMVPFVREFICNITMRMPLAVLMIPPINANLLVEDYHKRLLPKRSESILPEGS